MVERNDCISIDDYTNVLAVIVLKFERDDSKGWMLDCSAGKRVIKIRHQHSQLNQRL
jgi:hypothetical protein